MPRTVGIASLGIVLTIAMLLSAPNCAVAYETPQVYVPGIIDKWEDPVVKDRNAVGFALSLAFINWPSIFLREMNQRPDAFKSWLSSLEQHTVRYDDEPGRAKWVFEQMHELAVGWDGLRYRDMTELIRQATERFLTRPGFKKNLK